MKGDEKGVLRICGIHYETGNAVSIEITNGLISGIDESDAVRTVNPELFIAPGLIDNQINGYSGVDFSGNDFTSDDVISVTRSIWKEGVTSFLPTLITNSHENLKRNFSILAGALRKDEKLRESIPGFHLEGPYISPDEGYRGCHPYQHIRKPSIKEFLDYQKAADGKIIQITLAPEVEGAMEFIRDCTDNGIIIALGHTNATAGQIALAVENGARLSTHLGNGCANFIHRHSNPIWPQLANSMLTISVIADGQHLLPEELRVFYKVKGPGNIMLTSDVIYLAGMAPGKYSFLGNDVILTDEGMLLNKKLNCLAGASFPLKKGVENIMNFTGCSLTKAINMASSNVAAIYSLQNRGKLSIGARADLILFGREKNELLIKKTYLNGNLVFNDY